MTVSNLLVGPEDLHKSHYAFLGTEPTTKQCRIYDAFPEKRGVRASELDSEVFEALIVMGLVQTFAKKTQASPFRVYFFVPQQHERWAVKQLRSFAKTVFARLKERRASSQAQALGRAFHSVLIGCRVLQVLEAPDRWVAYGFSESYEIPDWMATGLTDVPA